MQLFLFFGVLLFNMLVQNYLKPQELNLLSWLKEDLGWNQDFEKSINTGFCLFPTFFFPFIQIQRVI